MQVRDTIMPPVPTASRNFRPLRSTSKTPPNVTADELRLRIIRQGIDADKFMARDDKDAAPPARVLPSLRAALAALPRLPIASQIDFGAEQIMLGGRPLQNLSGGLHGDAVLWAIDRLDLRAPGSTRVTPGPTASMIPQPSENGVNGRGEGAGSTGSGQPCGRLRIDRATRR